MRKWMGLLVVMSGCTGSIGGGAPNRGPSSETLSEIGESGLRRLTANEYDRSVRDLLGVTIQSELALPEDARTPFDNDFTRQQASQALISAADALASQIAGQVIADPVRRSAMMPCVPAGADDRACFRSFVAKFGRQILRRTLSVEEIEPYLVFMAGADGFWVAVDSALRVLLQHPSFLYRVEIGTQVAGEPGVFRLDDNELATRLSFAVWGSTPPTWLLDLADEGGLSDAEGVKAAVVQLMGDDRAKDRFARFHSMWMGYEKLPPPAALADAMQMETGALINKVVFEGNLPWVDMLRSRQTYLNDELAAHYGLPAPDGGEGWVDYGDAPRQGLLSQGSFLSAVAKFSDTSPTQRGLLIRTRLFCQEISTPPADLMVNTDEPPGAPDPEACKSESYNMWKTDGCKTCHAMMDPVGFGLENFDTAGVYREFEPGRPECVIDGTGAIDGNAFSGPVELSNLMIEQGNVEQCVATMMYRFTMGRYKLEEADSRMLERLVSAAQGGETGELKLYDLTLEMLSSEAFRHRRQEVVQ